MFPGIFAYGRPLLRGQRHDSKALIPDRRPRKPNKKPGLKQPGLSYVKDVLCLVRLYGNKGFAS